MKELLGRGPLIVIIVFSLTVAGVLTHEIQPSVSAAGVTLPTTFDQQIAGNAAKMMKDRKQTFRFDTFGDQDF